MRAHRWLSVVLLATLMSACGGISDEDRIATQVATALVATQKAQSDIDAAVAATMSSNAEQNSATQSEPTKAQEGTRNDNAGNTAAQSTATSVVVEPSATAVPVAVATDTAVVVASATAVPTETVAASATSDTVATPIVIATIKPVMTLILKPTNTIISVGLTPIQLKTPIILTQIPLPTLRP